MQPYLVLMPCIKVVENDASALAERVGDLEEAVEELANESGKGKSNQKESSETDVRLEQIKDQIRLLNEKFQVLSQSNNKSGSNSTSDLRKQGEKNEKRIKMLRTFVMKLAIKAGYSIDDAAKA